MASWSSGREWMEDARFWLPDDRERLCYGHLRYAPDRGPEVHVMDSPLVPGYGEPPISEIPVFHGETLGGQPFTLLDGFLTNASEKFGGGGPAGSIADALFATLVRGAHVNGVDEVRCGEAIVEMHGLLDLLIGAKVDQPLLQVTAEKASHDQIAVDMPFGTLTLGAGVGGSFSRTERKHTLGASAFVRFNDELLLSQIDRLLGPLRDLIVFATRESSFISDLVLLPPKTTPPEIVEIERYTHELRLIRARDAEPSVERRSSYYSLWLNPATVPDAAQLFASWWDLRERLGPVWTLLFGTLQRPSLPLENQLLNLTAFAEGYHRTLHDEQPLTGEEAKAAVDAMLAAVEEKRVRAVFRSALTYANAQTQRKRMRWLAERAARVISAWDLDVSEFCKELADTRNWLTHWGNRGKHTQEGPGLVRLIARLDLVISVNVLLDLGLDHRVAAEQIGSGARLWPALP